MGCCWALCIDSIAWARKMRLALIGLLLCAELSRAAAADVLSGGSVWNAGIEAWPSVSSKKPRIVLLTRDSYQPQNLMDMMSNRAAV